MDNPKSTTLTLPFIPNLVGINITSELYKKLFPFHDLYYSKLVDDYKEDLKYKYYYTIKCIEKNKKLDISDSYDATSYRSSYKKPYYIRSHNIGGIKSYLLFNTEVNEFLLNEDFISKLITTRVQIGELYSLQSTIKGLIFMDLFLNGYYLTVGAAFHNTETNKSLALVMPRHNGKTTIINKLLSQDKYEYIAENLLIIDLMKLQTFQYPPEWYLNKYESKLIKIDSYPQANNYNIEKIIMGNNTHDSYCLSIHEQYMLSTAISNINSAVFDYVMLTKKAKKFFKNITEELSMIEELQEKGILSCNAVNKFNFEKIL